MINKTLKSILLDPPYVKWSSQTIYQALLGCIKIYEYTKSDEWKNKAEIVYNILCEIQQPDGGFDIGYDFNFGMLHKKGETTSPEMVGFLALIEYGRVFGFDQELKKRCESCTSWIKRNVVKETDELYYLPYAPYSTSKIMVYNGTSFVAGALGRFLGITNSKDEELIKIYKNLNNYLHSKLVVTENGAYWPYYDVSRDDLDAVTKSKIDNFHIMQQVEMHVYAEEVYPYPIQLETIKKASNYIENIHNSLGIVPYYNPPFNDKFIHLWGFSSVLSGMLSANKVLTDSGASRNKVIYDSYHFIKSTWTGKSFVPIVNREGKPVYTNYMVRSDAWVFNSLSSLLMADLPGVNKDELLSILYQCYQTMNTANFSGKETHASNTRTRFIGRFLKLIK